jgi:CRISPR/Cas system Type II protein with McrA/HNH and RuvC-like nuclease domain
LLEKINFINFIIKNSFKSLTNKKIFKEFKFSPIPNGPKDKDFDIFKSLFHINFFLPYTKSKNLFIENENTFDFETLGTLNDFSDKMNKNIDLSYFDDNDINNKKDKKEDAKSEEKENKKPLKLSNICKEENKLKNLQDLCNEYQIKEEELAEYINKNGKAYFSNGSLSIKALNIILPELLNESLNLSNILNDKQKQTRLFVNKANKKNKKEILKNINNPNVNKVSKLCLKVIKKYISENEDKIDLNDVQFIIEMARDFNTKEERDKIYKINEENNKKNIKIQDELDKGKFKISGTNILKYKLFEEQDGECPYSGEKINKDKLQNYDIDHIYAYS